MVDKATLSDVLRSLADEVDAGNMVGLYLGAERVNGDYANLVAISTHCHVFGLVGHCDHLQDVIKSHIAPTPKIDQPVESKDRDFKTYGNVTDITSLVRPPDKT